jgi:hypothetical protein
MVCLFSFGLYNLTVIYARLNLIHNALLGLNSDMPLERREQRGRWAIILAQHAPPLIDRYLDIQYILGLNSSIATPAPENAWEKGGGGSSDLMYWLYVYLLKVISFPLAIPSLPYL